jgi:hypothetical protein
MYTLLRGGVQRVGTPSAGTGGPIPLVGGFRGPIPLAGGSGGKQVPSGGSGANPVKQKLPCKSIL